MKKNIHPEWKSEVPVTSGGKEIMKVGSTIEEIVVEIWSGNHPFYTGKENIVDSDNLVEKFQNKLNKVNSSGNLSKSLKRKKLREKRQKGEVVEKNLTLKDMLKQIS